MVAGARFGEFDGGSARRSRALRVTPRMPARFAVRLLPFDFRSEFGSEMENVFREQREETERRRGMGALLRIWASTMLKRADSDIERALFRKPAYRMRVRS